MTAVFASAGAVIDRIVAKAQQVLLGEAEVRPGQDIRLSEAASVGDYIRQGDLYLRVAEVIPEGFEKIEAPTEEDKQLVPGQTQGAKHCLDSLAGVTLYRPKGWGEDWDRMEGPVFRLEQERTVLHPTHGSVVLPADMIIECFYQREWDSELQRQRRNAD